MDLVVIASIVRPRGLRGEVVAELLTDFPKRFDGLSQVTARAPDGSLEPLQIEESWFQNERIVLKFAGIDSIEAAEPFRGYEICVPETDTVELGEDEFYDWQLTDCKVVTTPDGELLGRVREVMRTGGTEILCGRRR